MSSILSSDDLKSFERVIERYQLQYQVPGLSVALTDQNRILYAQGFGVRDIQTCDPATPETLYPLGSMSKSLTAVMNATQVDDGLFDFDTLLKDINADRFVFQNSQTLETIKVRHVMGMTSGIGKSHSAVHDGNNALYWSTESPAYVLQALISADYEALPGEKYRYNNEMYACSGYFSALTKKRNLSLTQLLQDYKDLMYDRVFLPMGMLHTAVTPDLSSVADNYATSYGIDISSGEVKRLEISDLSRSDINGVTPSGQIVSSVMDLSLLARTLMNGGKALNGLQVVSDKNIQKLWTRQPIKATVQNFVKDSGYGLGWQVQNVDGVSIVGHGGFLPAWSSYLMLIPEKNFSFSGCANSWAGKYLLLNLAKWLTCRILDQPFDSDKFYDVDEEYEHDTGTILTAFTNAVPIPQPSISDEFVQDLIGVYEGGWTLQKSNRYPALLLFTTGWIFYLYLVADEHKTDDSYHSEWMIGSSIHPNMAGRRISFKQQKFGFPTQLISEDLLGVLDRLFEVAPAPILRLPHRRPPFPPHRRPPFPPHRLPSLH